jgi:hypothetical protein
MALAYGWVWLATKLDMVKYWCGVAESFGYGWGEDVSG